MPNPLPKLYPMDIPRPSDSIAETKTMFPALRESLPKGWYAWHSLKIRTKNNLLGEGDFVICVPGRGLILIEVKGGIIEQKNGHWYQNGDKMSTPPLSQSLFYKSKLCDRLDELNMSYGCAESVVCFPDTPFSVPPKQDDLRGHVIGARDLPYLREWLMTFADQYLASNKTLSISLPEKIHELWGETWVPTVRLGDAAHDHLSDLIQLDNQQIEFFNLLTVNSKMRICGPAGSGKTILAREFAIQRSKQEKRVLFLCYTDPLASWLSEELKGTAVHVQTVKRYAADLLLSCGKLKSYPATAEMWLEVTLDAVDAVSTDQWDCIVIDEAQDLTEKDWLFVEGLIGALCDCYVFYDDKQTFWSDRKLPDWVLSYFLYPLGKPYRCPQDIWLLAQSYSECTPRTVPCGESSADTVKVVFTESPRTLPSVIRQEVNRLCAMRFRPADFAIISLVGETRTEIVHCSELDGLPVFRANDESAAMGVISDTFLRFKGLERPVILIVGHEMVLNDKLNTRMHIALSRATALVRIFTTKEAFLLDSYLHYFDHPEAINI